MNCKYVSEKAETALGYYQATRIYITRIVIKLTASGLELEGSEAYTQTFNIFDEILKNIMLVKTVASSYKLRKQKQNDKNVMIVQEVHKRVAILNKSI